MAHSEALLKVLNNVQEPHKRIKLADSAFKSSQMPIQRKEALLLKWALNTFEDASKEDIWSLVNSWLDSEQFKDLNQNDISNEDIAAIIELCIKQVQDLKETDVLKKKQVLNSILCFCNSRIFQQYFKYNLELYFKFISATIKKTDYPLQFAEFIKNPNLFPKNFLVEDKFCKYFVDILIPVLIEKIIRFKDSENVFEDVSKIVQKCIFQGNIKKFESFFAQYFGGTKIEKEHHTIPKIVFKYLALAYSQDLDTAVFSYKLFFHAFFKSYTDLILPYKFFILTMQRIGFNVSPNFALNKAIKTLPHVTLTYSLEIILTILKVISTKGYTECNISEISFTEFLRKILISVISLQRPSSTICDIILKSISINPLVIEPIVSEIIVFLIFTVRKKLLKSYENVMIAVFEVFAKLHRIEHLFAKLIPTLKINLIKGNQLKELLGIGYTFDDDQDVEFVNANDISVQDILTENIQKCFTVCICELASWQVINLLKTLLFHLKVAVQEYADANEKQDMNSIIYLEMLGIFAGWLLQSVRIAGHTIQTNVVAKFVNGLGELEHILKTFGSAILNKEHNHIAMRTFLNLAYVWAEIYTTLTYYAINEEVNMSRVVDNNFTACNLTYLHSYLDVEQWQLISQRITNFGEYPCKSLLRKMYIQKLRAMLLFEKNLNDDIVTNIVKILQIHLEDTWQDHLSDKFTVNFVMPKMNNASVIYLAERLIDHESLHCQNHIKDSITLTNAVTYVAISKINKLFKHKRKLDENSSGKPLSSKIFAFISESVLLSDDDVSQVVDDIKKLFDCHEDFSSSFGVGNKQDKLSIYLSVLKKFPIIYSSTNTQKVVLLYLFALYGDISSCSEQTKTECEDLIIGILQSSKFQIMTLFRIDTLSGRILKYFKRYDVLFSLIIDNVFKNEESIKNFEPFVSCLRKNLDDPKYLSSSILVVQAANKIKKSKMDSTTKDISKGYKEKILGKISKLACKSDFLIEAYATCLKHYLATDGDREILQKLLDRLGSYVDYALENISSENKKGCLILFTAILHNKQKIQTVDEGFVLNVWNALKKIDVAAGNIEEYSHLVKLLVTLIPNDEFNVLVTDLLNFTEKSIQDRNFTLLSRQLQTWESILTCDVNALKMKVLQEVFESVIQKLLGILKNEEYERTLFNNIIHLEESIIQNQRFILSSPLIDMFIITVTVLASRQNANFENIFNLSFTVLEKLLKHRNALIMDRLPAYLQQYRILLRSLCAKSNSDSDADSLDVSRASDCAHNLEKLTKNMVSCKKDMSRISTFLIADILERYEQINLYPNVKLHLNNCVYSLISLCDHHAVAYLMRVLSSASTEMFKILYEHYKKYYMFTGKV